MSVIGFGVRYGSTQIANTTTTASTLSSDGDATNNLGLTTPANCVRMHVQNLSATADVYWAPASGVTADDGAAGGFVLEPREVLSVDWPKADVDLLYFVVASGNARIRVLFETVG